MDKPRFFIWTRSKEKFERPIQYFVFAKDTKIPKIYLFGSVFSRLGIRPYA